MQATDALNLKGVLDIRVFEKGALIEHWTENNLIVAGAREMLAQLLAGDGAGSFIQKFGVGTSSTAPNPSDTSLTGAYWRNLDGFSYPTPGQVQFKFKLDQTEANGTAIREFGLRTANGNLFSRKVRGTIEKNDDISIEGTWTITL